MSRASACRRSRMSSTCAAVKRRDLSGPGDIWWAQRDWRAARFGDHFGVVAPWPASTTDAMMTIARTPPGVRAGVSAIGPRSGSPSGTARKTVASTLGMRTSRTIASGRQLRRDLSASVPSAADRTVEPSSLRSSASMARGASSSSTYLPYATTRPNGAGFKGSLICLANPSGPPRRPLARGGTSQSPRPRPRAARRSGGILAPSLAPVDRQSQHPGGAAGWQDAAEHGTSRVRLCRAGEIRPRTPNGRATARSCARYYSPNSEHTEPAYPAEADRRRDINMRPPQKYYRHTHKCLLDCPP
jgi:hypothetical protein